MPVSRAAPPEDVVEPEYDSLLDALLALRAELVAEPVGVRTRLSEVHPDFHDSARNLLHYLVLRRRDLRPLQRRLAALGLSSLGRAESHVLATVDAVIAVLRRLTGRDAPRAPGEGPDFTRGVALLTEHTDETLGPAREGRDVRILVTMPSEAADDPALVHDLVRQGMDGLRINCAHDDPRIWSRIIGHLRRAESTLGRRCRVVMDLGGPKLRTGPIEPGPAVLRVRPARDVHGKVTAPARVWLNDEDAPTAPPTVADARLQVPAAWLEGLGVGDRLALVDARGSRRAWTVLDRVGRACWVEAARTTYVTPDTVLTRPDGATARLSGVPPREQSLRLQLGDRLTLTRDQRPGRDATHDGAGRLLTPATIGSTLPQAFDRVKVGEPIWFDDGKLGGVVETVESDRLQVRITQARPGGDRLRSDKGINLPESDLDLPALTAKDLVDLAFVAEHADAVELSFANSAADVAALQERLAAQGPRRPAIVLKIETRRGFDHLPEMLLAAMRWPRCGVMIARGDLAVETGFVRLAEVQEEILWICEAAHVPVIWATQVLENLAKDGMPSRAEITDAAMGHRAECVMLNKGPHVLQAVRVLDDILRRMQAHQTKKQAMLRELRLAHRLPFGEG